MSDLRRNSVSPPALGAAGSVSGSAASSCREARVAMRPSPVHTPFALWRVKEHAGLFDKGFG